MLPFFLTWDLFDRFYLLNFPNIYHILAPTYSLFIFYKISQTDKVNGKALSHLYLVHILDRILKINPINRIYYTNPQWRITANNILGQNVFSWSVEYFREDGKIKRKKFRSINSYH